MHPTPQPFVVPQEINDVSGPPFLVGLANGGLLGVLSVQVYLYYLAFPKDRVYLKWLVYGIYVLEFVQFVLIIDTLFRTFVTKFGDVQALDQIETLWLSVPIITAIDTFFVQVFYAHRISTLAQSKKVAGIILILSFIQLGGGIATGAEARQRKYYSVLRSPEILVRVHTVIGIWNVGSVICDVIIAVCMTYYLSRYDTSIKQTKVILKKIVRLTIETGSLTAAIGILTFVMATINFPGGPYYYQTPMGVIGKVYANSMLVLLNSRMMLMGPEERVISSVNFGVAPANDTTGSGNFDPH